MSLVQFLIVVRARYRIVLAVLVAVVALTLVVSFLMPRHYTAQTQLYLDLLAGDLVGNNGASLSANSSSSYLPTQVEIMKSDAVAQKVVTQLHLDQDPARHEAWLRATKGRGSELAWLGNVLRKDLDVRSKMDSNIVVLTFRATDPVFAAAAANAFTSAYLDASLDLSDGPARNTAKWLAQRVDAARVQLQQAQQKVLDFQRDHGIVTSDQRADSETERLALLSQQLVAEQGQNADTRSRLQSGSASASGGLSDGVAAKVRSDIADLRAKMSETATTLGPNHPTYLQMQSRLDALEAELPAEGRRASGAIAANLSAGKIREAQTTALVAAQKEHLVDLATARAGLDGLEKDRDAAQATLRELTQKYEQADLLAHSVQTNVSVLTAAVEPLVPTSPKPLLYGLIALVMGTLLGIAAAFAWELADRRVRSDDDIADLLGAPVLGTRRRVTRAGTRNGITPWSHA
jgi:polysaccharide biosynthesis transport protein